MEDIEVLRCHLARLRSMGVQSLYRGQSNKNWQITSTLRRYQGNNSIDDLWNRYKSAFEVFCAKTEHLDWNKFKPYSENDKFYKLSIARHLGLPCNLIDWSSSIDTALLMACMDSFDVDGCLFVILGDLNINDSPINFDPFEEHKTLIVCKDFDLVPNDDFATDLPVARKRRFRQNGFFTIISKDYIDSEFENILPTWISMIKIPICNTIKNDIVDYLNKNGKTSEWLFLPGYESTVLKQLICDIKSKYFNHEY